ncbi:hypothetical protein [Pseudoduganella buxea]|uniref:Uncharacterized protein n=1 Tax=Pseudoduganella buxea TaxID=1949069 RepID=A0A6I3T9I1_9BURK|nr:hypothetical protein [Pseudoduganella buxea]MTV56327.1 hypothetical protein [Pseudoduganella buxea]
MDVRQRGDLMQVKNVPEKTAPRGASAQPVSTFVPDPDVAKPTVDQIFA